MLESSDALSPELGLKSSLKNNMEKNPNCNGNNKVPPRSSSTGPAPGDSKPKTGDYLHSCFFNLVDIAIVPRLRLRMDVMFVSEWLGANACL